jgi:myo-inositol-1(or 4)-monophosphatase
MNMSDAFLEVALDAATRSGELLRSRFGSPRDIAYKGGPTNLVTEMDGQAEALIVEAIRHRFPDHAILAEESGASRGSAPYRWIVDPLDGTTNYAHGVPIFAVSIALEIEGRLELGVVVDPCRHERFTARRGTGAFLNGQPISVSETPSVEKSLLSTGYPYDIRSTRETNLPEHDAFALRCRSRRALGSAVLSLAWVAAGRLAAYREPRLGPWDVAAGAVLVEEAGGRVSHMNGGPLDVSSASMLASNGRIHAEILETLKAVQARAGEPGRHQEPREPRA